MRLSDHGSAVGERCHHGPRGAFVGTRVRHARAPGRPLGLGPPAVTPFRPLARPGHQGRAHAPQALRL